MCVCVCLRARVRAHVCVCMRHGTAAMAAYDDAEPRLDVCGETDDEAGGEDWSDCACACANAAIRAVQNRSGKRIEQINLEQAT